MDNFSQYSSEMHKLINQLNGLIEPYASKALQQQIKLTGTLLLLGS